MAGPKQEGVFFSGSKLSGHKSCAPYLTLLFMCCAFVCMYAWQGFMMYVELLRKRCYWPGIIVGATMASVAALLDPISRSYVAYQTLTRAGATINSAILMSSLTLHGAFALGECAIVGGMNC